MYKIAVMGDRDSIYGFAALGLDTYPVTDPVEAARRLRSTQITPARVRNLSNFVVWPHFFGGTVQLLQEPLEVRPAVEEVQRLQQAVGGEMLRQLQPLQQGPPPGGAVRSPGEAPGEEIRLGDAPPDRGVLPG